MGIAEEEEKGEVDSWPKDALGPFPPERSPGPTTARPSPGNQAEQEGASQYSPGGGGEPG